MFGIIVTFPFLKNLETGILYLFFFQISDNIKHVGSWFFFPQKGPAMWLATRGDGADNIVKDKGELDARWRGSRGSSRGKGSGDGAGDAARDEG